MCFSFVFVEEDAVLDVEVAFVVLQIDIFGEDKDSDDLFAHFGDEGYVWGVGVGDTFFDGFYNLVSIVD